MIKSKIAVSIDTPLLEMLDSKVDGSIIRSRSQALEFFLRKGLMEQSISDAVLLIKGEQQHLLLKKIDSKSLIQMQIEFFAKVGVRNLYIVTQHTKHMNELLSEISDSKINIEIAESNSKGNAEALKVVKNKIKGNFIVMSGDTFNNFDLMKMIKKHSSLDKMATMGLMTRENVKSYGTAILDGDLIIDFAEKSRHHSTNIVNAGIYIFKPEIFELFENTNSLEKDLFPKLARLKQLVGFFTYGEYMHLVLSKTARH